MRRPLPPELIVLGDHLESAVGRSVGRRRTRRQLALNAATGILVAMPLLPGVLGSFNAPAVVAAPAIVERTDKRAYGGAENDFPPRVLRGAASPSDDVLAEPSTLRRALR